MRTFNPLMVVTTILLFLSGCQQSVSTEQTPQESDITTEQTAETDTSTSEPSQSNESSKESESELAEETSNELSEPSDQSGSTEESSETRMTSETESTMADESIASENNATAFPYAVANENLKAVQFYKEGMNIPTNIQLNGSNDTITFTFPDGGTALFNARVEQVPTEEIQVLSADTNEPRMVRVNTTVQVGEPIENPNNHDLSGTLYIFHNSQGTLSLATPNYAGNVGQENTDMLLEFMEVQ